MITFCSNSWEATPNREIFDESMDICGRSCGPRCGGVVAFAGSRAARDNAAGREERIGHLRAIPRFPAPRSGTTPGAAGTGVGVARPFGCREDEPRESQGLLRSAGGDARRGTRQVVSGAL